MNGSELALFGKLFATIAASFAEVATAANNNVFGVVVAFVVLLGLYFFYSRGQARRRYGLERLEVGAQSSTHPYRPPARLRVLTGPFKGKTVSFDSCILLGRDPNEAQLAFPSDRKISRSHCAVRFEPSQDRFRVKDLGSLNHTLLVRRNGDKSLLLPFVERGAAPGDRLVLAKKHEVILELAR